jgi:hypothetical protein
MATSKFQTFRTSKQNSTFHSFWDNNLDGAEGSWRVSVFKMLRTAVRQLSTTSRRAAGTVQHLTLPEIEAGARHAIDISKAQGVAQRGLVDGMSLREREYVTDAVSNWQNTTHQTQQALRRNRLRSLRQSRISKPRWIRQRSCSSLCRRKCRKARFAETWRDSGRRHSRQHGYWLGPCVPQQRLQAGNIHAQHAITRKD